MFGGHKILVFLHVCPPVWLLANIQVSPLFSVVCNHVPLSLLTRGHGYVVSPVSRLLGSTRKQKRGVPDKLQAQHRSHHFQLNSPHYSSSQHLSSSLIPLLTSGYLTAKTNCLTEGIHNSSYTLWIYKSPVLPCKYGKSMLTVWCQYRFLLAGKKERLFQLLHVYYIYINVVLSHFCSQHMLNTCAFWG